ncbi:MAG TPA: phosphonoacetaldehyde reductase [Clostridiales bacterium]|nr:phosphonoacetaldehyde reductase [Clostridiales bacterium]
MSFKPFCSTEIVFTNMSELSHRLLSIKANNVLLVMSESAVNRWGLGLMVDSMQKKCESSSGTFIWIKSVAANPTQRDITECLHQIGNKKIEAIIALGGGSAIDLAKGICAFYDREKNSKYTINMLTGLVKNKRYSNNKENIDIIAVPTTAGTGSEVTQWATIWDESRTAKFSIDDPGLKPELAIIVPELTVSMPPKMTVSTGLDAMCQAVEAYWSKHTTPVVQEIAYRAVEIIIENLRRAVDEPSDITVREKLCRASVLAGLAFSQTRTTACHSISYPLTMLYGIPHGLAASISLDGVGAINKGHFPNDTQLFSLFDKFGGIKNFIDKVSSGVVTMRLTGFGITENDISNIAKNAFTGGRMDNNPVDLSAEDVESVLRAVL